MKKTNLTKSFLIVIASLTVVLGFSPLVAVPGGTKKPPHKVTKEVMNKSDMKKMIDRITKTRLDKAMKQLNSSTDPVLAELVVKSRHDLKMAPGQSKADFVKKEKAMKEKVRREYRETVKKEVTREVDDYVKLGMETKQPQEFAEFALPTSVKKESTRQKILDIVNPGIESAKRKQAVAQPKTDAQIVDGVLQGLAPLK